MSSRILLRRDTGANWAAVNPVLAAGEIGLELDTGKAKFGDGTAAWNALPYAVDVPFTKAMQEKLSGIDAGAQANPANLDGVKDSTARLAMTPAERAKLTGIQAGAQVNPANLDGIPDGSARVAMSAAERSKLGAIEAGAQANPPAASDAEVDSGAATAGRTFTPAQLKRAAQTFGGGGTGGTTPVASPEEARACRSTTKVVTPKLLPELYRLRPERKPEIWANVISASNRYTEPAYTDANVDTLFPLIRNAGISGISLRIIWEQFEDSQGVLNTSAISNYGRLLDKAEQHGLDVTLDFHTLFSGQDFIAPNWITGISGDKTDSLQNMWNASDQRVANAFRDFQVAVVKAFASKPAIKIISVLN